MALNEEDTRNSRRRWLAQVRTRFPELREGGPTGMDLDLDLQEGTVHLRACYDNVARLWHACNLGDGIPPIAVPITMNQGTFRLDDTMLACISSFIEDARQRDRTFVTPARQQLKAKIAENSEVLESFGLKASIEAFPLSTKVHLEGGSMSEETFDRLLHVLNTP